jgi:hypothetical protein
MEVAFAREAIINYDDLHSVSQVSNVGRGPYSTKRSHEDVVASQEGDEGLCSRNELPGHNSKT